MALRIALTGGGTGGHVFPVVAVAQAIKEQNPDVKFLWLGSSTGQEKDAAEQAGIPFVEIPTGKIRRYFSLANIIDLFKVPLGILKAYFALASFRPKVLFSKGGYVSYPVVFGAWLHDLPILLHETDAVPGLANRRLLNKATLIATSFPEISKELPEEKTIFTGQPVRQEINSGDAARAKQKFDLSDDKPVLSIFGGSQGALAINKVIYQILPELLPHYQVIHQVGPKNLEEASKYQKKYAGQDYNVAGFFTDDLWDVYAVSDVIMARSGGQIHEFGYLGKPVVLLPLAGSASDHQVHNADYLAKNGAAISIQEANLTPAILLGELLKILHDNALRLSLGNKVKEFANPMASKKLAYWVLKLAEIR